MRSSGSGFSEDPPATTLETMIRVIETATADGGEYIQTAESAGSPVPLFPDLPLPPDRKGQVPAPLSFAPPCDGTPAPAGSALPRAGDPAPPPSHMRKSPAAIDFLPGTKCPVAEGQAQNRASIARISLAVLRCAPASRESPRPASARRLHSSSWPAHFPEKTGRSAPSSQSRS